MPKNLPRNAAQSVLKIPNPFNNEETCLAGRQRQSFHNVQNSPSLSNVANSEIEYPSPFPGDNYKKAYPYAQ